MILRNAMGFALDVSLIYVKNIPIWGYSDMPTGTQGIYGVEYVYEYNSTWDETDE
jgi:hypothetical protein